MGADVLATQGAMPAAANIVTMLNQINSAPMR